jgi:hypothetical protein
MSTTAACPVAVDIQLDVLSARDTVLGQDFSGVSLVNNLEIHLRHQGTGEEFDLLVTDLGQVVFRAGAPEVVPIYEFKARRRSGDKTPYHVCNRNTPLLEDPSWSGAAHHAIVYRGDRYDPMTKTVVPNDLHDGWAFIACNGGAGTKMHLHRHTLAGGFNNWGQPQYMTSLGERTALLKAITADYCGRGEVEWTYFGQRLAFATASDPLALSPPHSSLTSIEALWGPNGPVCLDSPRLEWLGATKAYVEAACGRTFLSCGLAPSWPLSPSSWTGRGHVLTGNPPPP